MKPPKKASPILTALIVIGLLGVSSASGFIANLPENKSPQVSTQTIMNKPMSGKSESTMKYKDGTYTANGTYPSPGGNYTIVVTLTIAGNTVKASMLKLDAKTGETSSFYQSDFSDKYKAEVIGKKVNQISLNRVGGSSLTSNGFNTALEQIKNDAKA